MKWKVWGKWVLGLGLLTVVFFLGDVRELTHLRVLWTVVFGMFLTTLGFVLLHTLRWKRIVDALSEKPTGGFLPFYQWMLHSYTLGYVMPKDVSLLSVRTYFLKQHQSLSLSAALFSVTLDRLLDFLVFFVVIAPSFLFVTRILSPIQSLLLMGILLAGLLVMARWKGGVTFQVLVGLYHLILKLPVLRTRMAVAEETSLWREALEKQGLFSMVSWSIGTFLLIVLRFFLTGMALGVPVSLAQSLFLVPVIQVSGLVNITPASLGVLELGSWGALLLIDLPRDQILRFVLGQRVLLTVVLLSLILLNQLFTLWKGNRGEVASQG